MIDKQLWKNYIKNSLENIIKSHDGGATDSTELAEPQVQTPPKPDMGDLAFPMFPYAKVFHTSPDKIACELALYVNSDQSRPCGEAMAVGPYLNIKIDVSESSLELHDEIIKNGSDYGRTSVLKGRKIEVEFSCPNTNKPLHLGHVRNDCLGSSISNILKFNGADVFKVNLINNRGIHICKSMLAYKLFGNGETPESSGIKGDHLVGKYYVRFSEWEKTDKEKADNQAQQMLKDWEAGDPETLRLWHLMNNWTLEGIKETYGKTGISFDKYYYESDTYKLGKDIILDGYEKGLFLKDEDGAIYIDNSEIGLDKKILLRKDGTSIYITQDIGTAIMRHKDWPFDSLVYVVASEQQYHFKVLFHVLDKLGYSWAENLHHLSYGMVFLPTGKMKSREGSVVDADDVLSELESMAEHEIVSKGRESEVDDLKDTSHKIALGALNYYMLQFNPERDFKFNPQESLSLTGNTGPYLQYMGARISSVLKKYECVKNDYAGLSFDPKLLTVQDEKQILKLLSDFPLVVERAGLNYDPSYICEYLYDLLKTFSHYYHDNQILNTEDRKLSFSRIELCRMILTVIQNAFSLIGIPFLEKM